ncbi:radical SAM/SPASM domain-containing protein [Paenibacillus pinihumi]|uniref:radical SAM/SPASM domain-containing protein n=1 Tax=Paenibacillus pinihumi TaxID=669462 RepID=UPI00040D68C0|nr:radical SAM protein [Paenibacillus pinihumi]
MNHNGTDFPDTLHFYPTMRCPLNCSYCYVEEVNKDRNELPLETYLRLLDEGAALGVHTYDIAGGEPFVWPHLMTLLRAIKNQSAASKVVTSGLLLDKYLEDFDQNRPLITELHVSIDSANPSLHDSTRGFKGLHKRVVSNIDRYLEKSLGPVKINYVLQKGTYREIEQMLDFTAALGVVGIDIQCMVDVSSKTKGQDYGLSPEEILDTLVIISKWIEHRCPDEFQVLFVTPSYMFPFVSRLDNIKLLSNLQLVYFPEVMGSTAFSKALFIKHNGDVTGSTSFINNDRWFIGNVMQHSIRELWENGAANMRSFIKERSGRLMRHGVCANCVVKRFCRGGDPEVFALVESEQCCQMKEQLSHLFINS